MLINAIHETSLLKNNGKIATNINLFKGHGKDHFIIHNNSKLLKI